MDDATPPDYNEFADPRLAALYNAINPIAADTEKFFLDLAAKLSAATIIDIGCGTGLLTYALAERGHTMIGLDPARAMLDVARQHPHSNKVKWIEGDATQLGDLQADLAIMTSHVAQFFLDDHSWHTTLKAIHQALRPGGHLAFESRNPLVEAWTTWTRQASQRTIDHHSHGQIEFWYQVTGVKDNRVRCGLHYLFTRSGKELVSINELIFRTQAEITQSLTQAGFSIEDVFGDWDSSPASAESDELIFVAKHV